MLVKVFPINLQDARLSFRVYRDPAKPDYLLFVEHFAHQAAYDAHTTSPEVIAL